MKKLMTVSIIIFVLIFLINTAYAEGFKKKFWGPFKVIHELQTQIEELNQRLDNMRPRENIEVYDYNDQFIGYLYGDVMSRTNGGSNGNVIGPILIPDLDAFVDFKADGDIQRNYRLYFTESDCNGTEYSRVSDNYAEFRYHQDRYFIIDPERLYIEIKSSSTGLGKCVNFPNPCDYESCPPPYVNAVTEIFEIEIPFNLPVMMPLRYK